MIWLLISVVVGIAAFVFYRKEKLSLRSFITVPILAFYLSFVATITIFARIPSQSAQYRLMLFWSYKAIAAGQTDFIAEVFWNFVLFIPIGIILMLLITHRFRVLMSLGCGLLMSAGIEVIQLIFHRGLFEFDDMVHNTLGTLIGIGIFLFVSMLGKRLTGKV